MPLNLNNHTTPFNIEGIRRIRTLYHRTNAVAIRYAAAAVIFCTALKLVFAAIVIAVIDVVVVRTDLNPNGLSVKHSEIFWTSMHKCPVKLQIIHFPDSRGLSPVSKNKFISMLIMVTRMCDIQ